MYEGLWQYPFQELSCSFRDAHSKYNVRCPLCGAPTAVHGSAILRAEPGTPSETYCTCGSCGEGFHATIEYVPRKMCWDTSVLSISVKGSTFPAMHYYPKIHAQDGPVATGREALEFLQNHGVDEVEYHCPKCHEKHKERIEELLKKGHDRLYGFAAVCPKRSYIKIEVEVHNLERCAYPYVIKVSSYLKDDNVAGIFECVNFITNTEDVKDHKSVKKMNLK